MDNAGDKGGKAAGGPGRKAGGRNKHDPAFREWVMATFDNTPAQEQARRAFMDTLEYARLVHIVPAGQDPTPKQMRTAAFRQEAILTRLLPYTEKKMPTMVEVTDKKRVQLVIGQVGAPDAPALGAGNRTIELVPANIKKSQQKQAVSLERVEKSDAEKSDARR